ncbi:glycosyltransferase family 4 protein [Thiothrix lacustris]|uniref:glycosyltransferase family 4 protein n=1 Tax=Thiothrix lacustris TaxID=525917 RepID=UPI0027E5A21D|nr:glycosyltransferase [Thiothrix lacustris]WMP17954.1 glycosyltransferase [Thiothrix lacustris]
MQDNSSLKKLVYISSIAASHQVKFCNSLRKYYQAHFIFYDYPDNTRGNWWRVSLGMCCEVLDNTYFKNGLFAGRYYSRDLIKKLNQINPDIIMIGGFSIPSNYFAYKWATKNNKRTIVFTERSRTKKGELRGRTIIWSIIKWIYRDIDLILVSADDAITQFRDTFGFGDKVMVARYAADIDDYYTHPIRKKKNAYTYIYANRLTEIYNPLLAIVIFGEIIKKYPESKLLMNNDGELKQDCLLKIRELNIEKHVFFLDNLQSWSDLNTVYKESDILILPAKFSNGNFTILEAMASGMGVVISDKILGVGNLIKDGVNGFNRSPEVKSFINAIEQYISDENLFKVHAEINRDITKPLSAEGTAKTFHEIISKKLNIK